MSTGGLNSGVFRSLILSLTIIAVVAEFTQAFVFKEDVLGFPVWLRIATLGFILFCVNGPYKNEFTKKSNRRFIVTIASIFLVTDLSQVLLDVYKGGLLQASYVLAIFLSMCCVWQMEIKKNSSSTPAEDKASDDKGTENFSDKVEALHKLMYVDELFRAPDLDLSKLAASLDMKPQHLTSLLQNELKTSFYQYVNLHRSRKAKELIEDCGYQDTNLLDIANMSGFPSKSTFNREFKKQFDCSPSEYRNSYHATAESVN